VTESNESNNAVYLSSSQLTVTAPITQLPDLTVPSGSFTPASISSGQSFTVNATVQNTGTGNAGSSVLSYYLSTTTNITSSSYLLGTTNVSSLTAGSSSSQQLNITFPSISTIPAGKYYICYYVMQIIK